MTYQKLETGKQYDDWADLELAGWTEGDGSGAAGYIVEDYFDADCTYRGPDESGIEPLFELSK